MVEIATDRRWEKTKHAHNKDTKYGMYRYRTRFGFPVKNHAGKTVGANIYTAKIIIRNASDGRKYLYDIVGIKKDITASGTFYSHIGKVVDEIKPQKMGAGGVVPYLKGKGVKNNDKSRSFRAAFCKFLF